MPSSQEIARVMAEMDRFNQTAKMTVTEERYEKRVASVGGSYGGLTALLQQGAPGNWASDHKSEAEKFAGWHYVAISSIGKAVRSANCEAYQEKVREYAKAYNEQDDDSEPLQKWHPLMKLLKRPNPSQSGASFREEVAIQLCLTGSALIWNVPNQMGRTVERYVIPTAIAEPRQPERGRPKGGWYINPEVARWQIESGWFLYTGLATAIGKVIDARDVQVVRFIHPVFKDEGQSPVSAGALWTDTSEKVDISRHSHLRNGSDPSVIIGIDGVEDEGTLQRMSAKFNEKYAGPSKHGKAMFVNGQNVKVEPVTRTPAEMAYEGAFLQFRDAIMALHGVTPIAAGIEAPSGDDGLYAPLKQFISGTVQPILDLMAEEDTEQLAGQFGEGISVLYTAKAVDDAKLTEQQINTDILAGAIEVDEIRKIRGRKPWGGEKGKAVAGQGAKEEPKPGLPGLAQGVPGLETKPNGLEPQAGSQALDPSKPPQGTPDPMKLAEEAVAKALGGFADRLSALLKSGDNCGTGAGGFKPGNDCARGEGGDINDVRPSKENIDRVISSNFSAGARLIDLDVKAESVKPMLSGSVADREKVDRLKEQISSPSGYLERIIIDTDGNVIEGQHRATALKELGVKSIPATVLADLTPTFNKLTASGLRQEHARNIIDHAVEIHGDGDSVQDYDTGKYAQSYVLVEDDIKQHYEKASQLSSKNSKRQVKHIQKGYFRNKRKSSDCGANAEGGGGFQPGNTCGRGSGSGESGGEGRTSKKKPVKKGKAKGVLAWAEEKFGDPEKAKAFADWFGESKVVDEDGNPLTVYHGSKADIAGEFAFDPSKMGENASAEGYGFYFTTDKATASGYKPQDSGSLAEVYLRVEKPIDVNQKGFTPSELSGIISEMVDAEIARYPDEISDYKDGFLSNYVDTYSTKREAAIREVAKVVSSGSDRAIEQIAELANASGSKSLAFEAVTKATGFDGVRANGYGGRGEAGGTIYVAWYPTQIKAANNQGTFDPNNPNIYKSGSSCGANAQGGGGFQPGNTCGKRDGKGGESSEGGGKGASVNPKILAWAREKFGDDTTAENFAKWFGNSKAVDEEGNPLVVYHGTGSDFDTFNTDRKPSEGNTTDPNAFIGAHFTASTETADRFAEELYGVKGNAQVKPVFLALDNPLMIGAGYPPKDELAKLEASYESAKAALENYTRERNSDDSGKARLEAAIMSGDDSAIDAALADPVGDELYRKRSEILSQIYQLKENNRPVKESEIYEVAGMSYDDVANKLNSLKGKERAKYAARIGRELKDKLSAKGYDGVFYENAYEEETGLGAGAANRRTFIAFRPTQIKSATGNSGTFDPKDPNITKSGSGCGANAEGGGGFQPGNTCGREDGAGESVSDAAAKKKQKANEREIGKWVRLGTELQRATGWSLSDLMDEAEKQGDRKAQIAWMEKELDSRRSGEFAEARKNTQPALDKIREKVVSVWDKQWEKIKAATARASEAQKIYNEAAKAWGRKSIEVYEAEKAAGNNPSPDSKEKIERLHSEVELLGEQMNDAHESSLKADAKKYEAENAARVAVANVLRKDAAQVMKSISPKEAEEFESAVRYLDWMGEKDGYASRVMDEGNQHKADLIEHEKGRRFMASALNPSIHRDAALSFVEIQDGVRAHAKTIRLDHMVEVHIANGEKPEDAKQLSIAPGMSIIGKRDDASVYIHELGHQVEHGNYEARRLATSFRDSRIKGDDVVSLGEKFPQAGYDSNEQGADDNFAEAFKAVGYLRTDGSWEDASRKAHYAGKIYKGYYQTEVVSMGFELLYKNPKAFAEADPEWFDLITGISTGRLLTKTISKRKNQTGGSQ